MKRIKPAKLKGFQDYFGEVMKARLKVMDAVKQIAGTNGFQMVETPSMEYAETLLGEGGETDKQVYKFEDNGGREVALRFDLTVPFARFAAENYGSYPLPFKRAQIGNVWRAEKPQKGRYREFYQCDFDIIGVDSQFADLEVVSALALCLTKLDVGNFTVSFGHRYILSGLLKHFLPEVMKTESGETEALIAIDKLDKIGADKVTALLEKLEGATPDGAKDLMELVSCGSNVNALDKVKSVLQGDEVSAKALDTTVFVVDQLNKLIGEYGGKAVIDLKIARGLAYYTGIVFETTLDEIPGFGSVCSGGRYNNLCDRFTNRELEGVGGSIGLDRLVAGLLELGKIGDGERDGVFVVVAEEGARDYAISIANTLRASGICTDIDLKSQKINKQFQAADKLNRKFAVVIGKNELENSVSGLVSIKDLETGTQENLEIGMFIKSYRGE